MIVMSHVWWVMSHVRWVMSNTWWGKSCHNTLQHTLQHTATHACRPHECKSCDSSVSHIWWGTHCKTHCNTHCNTLQHMHAGHVNVNHVTLPYAFSWVGLFHTTLSLSHEDLEIRIFMSHVNLVAVCCSVLQCVAVCVAACFAVCDISMWLFMTLPDSSTWLFHATLPYDS